LDILGTPIVGDKRYGKSHDRTLPRELTALADKHHFLHAQSLEFTLGGERIHIEAPPPQSFQDFAKRAELNS
jgi:23S rRNA-/tRNA-specific pseudouridylate synthase